MLIKGIDSSFRHSQNGMKRDDMEAIRKWTNVHGEVVIFRSTGSWSLRWIEWGYPTKNFHVKGKSSDWGPQAGLVPYDGVYSKVGGDPVKAAKGTKYNVEGLESGFAIKGQLELTLKQINEQVSTPAGAPPRCAITQKIDISHSKNLLLKATRSGKGAKEFLFRADYIEKAVKGANGLYRIFVYPEKLKAIYGRLVFDRSLDHLAEPLEVMMSNEVGAQMPMTGDYDLFAICPPWAQYGSKLNRKIVKTGIKLNGRAPLKDFVYLPGIGLDNVLDPTLHTAGSESVNAAVAFDRSEKHASFNQVIKKEDARMKRLGLNARKEHPDMGNLTPRILRCITEINKVMGAAGDTPKSPFRRVHHNAESHRNQKFGAMTRVDMLTKKEGDDYTDGFPLTVFQPKKLADGPKDEVFTIESLDEFQDYVQVLHNAGYYVPQSWVWGMTPLKKLVRT